MSGVMRRVVLLTFGVLTLGIAANDFGGTWKLNVEKSKLPPKASFVSQIMSVESLGPKKMRIAWEYILKTGQKQRSEVVFTCDGQEHPAPEIGPDFTATCEKINDTSDRIVTKKAGKTILETMNTLSDSGKVITVSQESFLRSGGQVDQTLLYERQ